MLVMFCFRYSTNFFFHRIIHKLITKEKQYIEDLDIVETIFITPLRTANPPVMTRSVLDEFIKEVFGNILQLRECNHQLLDCLYIRQREQGLIVQSIGDIFLTAATDFRAVYPIYIGRHPLAEKRLKEELEHNPEFRLFIEVKLVLCFDGKTLIVVTK
jgi:hypothetical protein